MSTPLPVAKNPQLFLLDSEGLLFCPKTARLYYLNTSAAFIWCCFEEGLEPAAVADAIAREFGVPRHVATKDLCASIAKWTTQGLLDEGESLVSGIEANEIASPPARQSSMAPDVPRPPAQEGDKWIAASRPLSGAAVNRNAVAYLPSSAVEHFYRVARVNLRIRFSSRKAECLVHPILAHLDVDSGIGDHEPAASFEITERESRFTFHRDGVELYSSLLSSDLVPVVQREMLLTAYESSGCQIAIHAAAVGDGRRSLLLPGVPGSGKSTLSAALIHSGLSYLTDELVLLMPKSHDARPVRASLGLKRGSWSLLAHQFPALETLPIYRQPDGTEVRYLAPPIHPLCEPEEYPVAAIVFPQYVPHGPIGLSELTQAKALYRLAKAGYAVPGGLDSATIEDLVSWISKVPCYELRVRDLDKADAELRGILA